MGYRVDYGPIKKVRGAEKVRTRVPALTVLFLMVFLLLVQLFWPQGAELLQHIFIPGDPKVTVAALETFAQELQQRTPLMDAFENFCFYIVEAANLASG